jgi:hypothetical protein
MGNQVSEEVVQDAETIGKLLKEENWTEATKILIQVDYDAPIKFSDLLKWAYGDLTTLLRKHTVEVLKQLPNFKDVTEYNPVIPRAYATLFIANNVSLHQEAENFILVGIDRFVDVHQQYGATLIDWWLSDYDTILEGVKEFGFAVIPLVAKIYELVLSCSYVDDPEIVQLVVTQASEALGAEHPLIEKLQVWAREQVG